MNRKAGSADLDGETVVFGNARGRYWLLLLVACAFVAMGVFLVFQGKPDARWPGIASIVFFGACAAVFVRQLLDNRPRLIFDEIGVSDRTLGVGRIPWGEIENARLMSVQGNHFVSLSLRDEAKWTAKLSPLQRRLVRANRALGFSGLNLNLSGVDVEPAAVLALVLTQIAGADRDVPDHRDFGRHTPDYREDVFRS